MRSVICSATLVVMTSFSLLAEAATDAASHLPACQSVAAACNSGGYTYGDHKDGKGLWVDCVQPLANSKSVAGVTGVTAQAARACMAAKKAAGVR